MRGLALCLWGLLGLGVGCSASGKDGQGEAARAAAKPAALEAAPARAVSTADAAARLSAQLAPRLSQSPANVTSVVHSDGRRGLRLNGSFSQAQIARIGADGRLTTTCVDNLDAAERAIRGEAEGATP